MYSTQSRVGRLEPTEFNDSRYKMSISDSDMFRTSKETMAR